MFPSAFKIVKIEHPLNKIRKLKNFNCDILESCGMFIYSGYFVHLYVTLITKVLSSQIMTWKIVVLWFGLEFGWLSFFHCDVL